MNQEALSKRIKTTSDLHGIVNTMKMLSSVSLIQYEKARTSLNQYAQTIKLAFQGVFSQEDFSYPNQTKNKEGKVLYLLIGSDNGLVGRFNRDLVQKFEENRPKNASVITIGKRITSSILAKDFKPIAVYSNSNSLKEISSLADALLSKINSVLSKENFEKVILYYNHKKNNSFELKTFQLFPFSDEIKSNIKQNSWPGRMIPLISNENEGLFSALVQEYLVVFLVQALTESLVCEHYIRMLHMQQAEKNIEKKLAELDLLYQQARQNKITDELIDIVSGAQAMSNPLTKK